MPARRWLFLLAFCLLSASDWLLPVYLPSALPEPLRAAAGFALAAGILGIATLAQARLRPSAPPRSASSRSACFKSAAYGTGLFVLPPLLATLAGGRVSAGSSVLVFSLVPVAVLLFEAQHASGFGTGGGRLTALLPGALAGAAGAALLLPFSLPPSPAGRFLLGAIALAGVVAALASVRLPLASACCSTPRAGALLCAAGALANALVAAAGSGSALPGLAWSAEAAAVLAAAALIATEVWLLLLLARALPPSAFAARYLLVPLLALGEGFVLAHGTLSLPVVAGFALMGGGAALLLRSARPESDAPDSILL